MTRILLCLVLLSISPLDAQRARFTIATGATMGVGYNYGTGWHLLGAVDLAVPHSAGSVRVDGMVSEAGRIGVIGGSASLVYHIAAAPRDPARVYLLAGLGLYDASFAGFDDVDTYSKTRIGFAGGAGVSVGLRPIRFFGEARYISVRTEDPTNFVLVTAGVSFGRRPRPEGIP